LNHQDQRYDYGLMQPEFMSSWGVRTKVSRGHGGFAVSLRGSYAHCVMGWVGDSVLLAPVRDYAEKQEENWKLLERLAISKQKPMYTDEVECWRYTFIERNFVFSGVVDNPGPSIS
jgi:hypothetical protein